MKAFFIAKLTLKRMFRTNYLIPLGLISFFIVAIFFTQTKLVGDSEYILIQSASFPLALITHLFLTLGSMWLATAIIPKELYSGHMRMNMTKPISSVSIILGHFGGMFAYLAAGALLMSVLLTLSAIIQGGHPGFLFVGYILQLLPAYGCLLALGIVFSLVTNRPLAFFFLLFLAGEDKWSDWAQWAAITTKPLIIKMPTEAISTFAYWVSPPISRLEELNIVEYMNFDFPFAKYLLILLYCISYLAIALLFASWLLDRKEI